MDGELPAEHRVVVLIRWEIQVEDCCDQEFRESRFRAHGEIAAMIENRMTVRITEAELARDVSPRKWCAAS